MGSNLIFKSVSKYVRAATFFGWTILVIILSVLPANEIIRKSNDDSNFRWDYLEHFGVFVIFAMLFGFWRSATQGKLNSELLYFLVIGGIYAAATEVIQLWIDGRTFNPVDLLFNLGGLVIGVAVTRIYIFK